VSAHRDLFCWPRSKATIRRIWPGGRHRGSDSGFVPRSTNHRRSRAAKWEGLDGLRPQTAPERKNRFRRRTRFDSKNNSGGARRVGWPSSIFSISIRLGKTLAEARVSPRNTPFAQQGGEPCCHVKDSPVPPGFGPIRLSKGPRKRADSKDRAFPGAPGADPPVPASVESEPPFGRQSIFRGGGGTSFGGRQVSSGGARRFRRTAASTIAAPRWTRRLLPPLLPRPKPPRPIRKPTGGPAEWPAAAKTGCFLDEGGHAPEGRLLVVLGRPGDSTKSGANAYGPDSNTGTSLAPGVSAETFRPRALFCKDSGRRLGRADPGPNLAPQVRAPSVGGHPAEPMGRRFFSSISTNEILIPK